MQQDTEPYPLYQYQIADVSDCVPFRWAKNIYIICHYDDGTFITLENQFNVPPEFAEVVARQCFNDDLNEGIEAKLYRPTINWLEKNKEGCIARYTIQLVHIPEEERCMLPKTDHQLQGWPLTRDDVIIGINPQEYDSEWTPYAISQLWHVLETEHVHVW
jgi:hypothetical protein